jgi:hypothetical protein
MLDLEEGSSMASIGAEREKLVATLDELDAAIAEAVVVLEATRASKKALRECIVNQQPLADALVSVNTAGNLASEARTLKNLERKRHQSRTAVFAVGLAEGVSIGELGRLYGFSRQLAQRFAKEARDPLMP